MLVPMTPSPCTEATSQIPNPPSTPYKFRLQGCLGAQTPAAAGSCTESLPAPFSSLGKQTGKRSDNERRERTVGGRDISECLCTWLSEKSVSEARWGNVAGGKRANLALPACPYCLGSRTPSAKGFQEPPHGQHSPA